MRGEGIKEKRMGKGKKELRTDSSILKLDIKQKKKALHFLPFLHVPALPVCPQDVVGLAALC